MSLNAVVRRTQVAAIAGLVAFLAEGSAPSDRALAQPTTAPVVRTAPSFDCMKTSRESEKMICGDADLAALESENARLFRLARDGRHAEPDRRRELIATERDWISGRDHCGRSADAKDCVAQSLVRRIHQLRQGYSDARERDPQGISRGPLVARCKDFDALIGVTFVNSDPGYVYAEWRTDYLVMKHVASGSGARYEQKAPNGLASLDTQRDGAMIMLPGGPEMTCVLEQGG